MARIVFIGGPWAGRKMDLPEGGLVFGRAEGCDCTIPDSLMSGRHAELRRSDGVWRVADLGSSNGTEVNARLLTGAASLTDGDVVTLGETQFVFRAEAASPAVPAGAGPEDVAMVNRMRERTESIRREVAKVIVGQQDAVNQLLVCLLSRGHALLVGVPGLAKTLMVSTLARVLDLKFRRIQFTPDLMPSDITGTEVLQTNPQTQEKEFRFLRGPVFCHVLLADEINRTPPKTQAALLEAMQERAVTAGNTTYGLESPFFVLATQNPIEQEGTYPLPEAQQDRFMFNVWVDYPSREEEERIVGATTVAAVAEPSVILGREEVLQLQDVVRKIPVSPHVLKYAIRLVRASRPLDPEAPDFIRSHVSVGAGPRAGQYLVLAAKARAVMEGRIHVSCRDIRDAALPVLRHRIYTNFTADSEGITSLDLVRRLLDAVREPSDADYPPEPRR